MNVKSSLKSFLYTKLDILFNNYYKFRFYVLNDVIFDFFLVLCLTLLTMFEERSALND